MLVLDKLGGSGTSFSLAADTWGDPCGELDVARCTEAGFNRNK
jgi:hypothetical protein